MIAVKQLYDQTQSEYIAIDWNNNELKLAYYKASGVPDQDGKYPSESYSQVSTKQIDLSALFAANTRFQVFLDKKNNFSSVYNMEDFLATMDGLSGVSFYNNLTLKGVIIYFGETVADCLVISYEPVATTSQYELSEGAEYPTDIITKHYPDYQKAVDVRTAKRRILEDIDPHSSLAYMEAQLDCVTKALFVVLDANPDLMSAVTAAFSEFVDFKSELAATSVFTVKSAADCLAEISGTKAKVRELQTAYYGVKKETEAE